MVIQPKQILLIVLAAISNFFLSYYLQFEPRALFGIAFFFLTLKAMTVLKGVSFRKRELIAIGLFAFLFDLSLILGFHITITGSTYDGSAFENYISPYSIIDFVALILIFPSLLVMLLAAYRFISSQCTSKNSSSYESSLKPVGPLGVETTFLLALIPFICWIPYLLIYWPGFIFGDTLSSLAQATGLASYSNHHPFLYTMFIKACLKIGNILGIGNTGGCVLYCLVQMGFMAYAFAYLSRWITTRCSLKKLLGSHCCSNLFSFALYRHLLYCNVERSVLLHRPRSNNSFVDGFYPVERNYSKNQQIMATLPSYSAFNRYV